MPGAGTLGVLASEAGGGCLEANSITSDAALDVACRPAFAVLLRDNSSTNSSMVSLLVR